VCEQRILFECARYNKLYPAYTVHCTVQHNYSIEDLLRRGYVAGLPGKKGRLLNREDNIEARRGQGWPVVIDRIHGTSSLIDRRRKGIGY
jgi:hypothetical protein